MGRPNPSRETKLSCANGNREMLNVHFFPCSAAQHEQDLIVFLYFLFFGDVHFHYNISIISI